MSLLANVLGDFKSSSRYAERALSTFKMIGNEYQLPYPLRMLAYSALNRGDIQRARLYLKESLLGNQQISHKTGILARLIALAEIELVDKNIAQSSRLYAFVIIQLEQETLRLMEPDQFAMKRLASALSKRSVDKALKQIREETERTSFDELIKSLSSVGN